MTVIDYYFGLGSPWSFIGLEPALDLAARFGARLRPRPIPLIEENGAIYSRDRPEARRAYWATDLRRWAALRGKRLQIDNRGGLSDPTPAGFLVIAAIREEQDWARLTLALQSAFWEEVRDIGNPDVAAAVATEAGFDAAALAKLAAGDNIHATWLANRETAKAAGVFGLPTFAYEDALYWGQDSLPFLERHLEGRPLP